MDKLTIAAYRTHAEGRVQITLSQTNEHGRGWGRRLAGPKHYNSGTTTLVEAELDAADAHEIRRMLDATFPPEPSEAEEALRIRLWLIEQALTPIDVQDDPAGIVGIVGPYLDGPIHPTDRAAYRAARATQES